MKDNKFREELVIDMKEQKRLENLKKQYDNNLIDEKDISKSDKISLTELYKKENQEIDMEIEKRKQNILRLLRNNKK